MTTRVGLALSIVEKHSVVIDSFAPYTIDKAQFDGHVYADKAPGLSLLAVPIVAASARVVRFPATPFESVGTNYRHAYLALIAMLTLAINGVATATAAAMLCRWCRMRGASMAAASFAGLTYGLATPLMWWSTIFVGHAPASAFLLLGFLVLSESLVPLPGTVEGKNVPIAIVRALLGGLLLGVAFMIEFTVGPAVAIVAACCGSDAVIQHRGWSRIVQTFLLSGVGLLGPMLVVGLYNDAAFGSPLHLGYASVQDFPGMRSGFYGISLPDPSVAFFLIAGWYRGLLPLAPVLCLTPFGVIVALRHPQWRAVAVGAVLIFVYYWLVDAGYFYWWGGDSTGPRQMLPGLALLLIPLAPLWDRSPPAVRWLGGTLLAVSAVFAALLAGMTVTTPEAATSPWLDVWLPMMERGQFPRLITSVIGVPGVLAFLPVIVIWAIFGTSLVRSARREAALSLR